MSWSASSFPISFPEFLGRNKASRSTAKRCAKAFAALANDIGDGRTPEQVADGFINIAVENMANAIKKISVQRGYDVTGYALNCFGGAGGQHACLVADALGMTTVLIHPFSSLLSAYGMGLADIRSVRQRAIEEPLPDNSYEHELEKRLVPIVEDLAREARDELLRQDVPPEDIRFAIKVHARYSGTDTALIYDGGWSGSDADYAARVRHFEELSAKYKPSQTYQDFPPSLPLRLDGHIFGYLLEADSSSCGFMPTTASVSGFAIPSAR